jgi:hypothetical protein
LDLEDSGLLRAHLFAPADAPVGEYFARLRCDEATLLSGTLQVRALPDQARLKIEPSAVSAGSRGVELELFAQGAAFKPGVSHVLFGDGTGIEIISTRFSSGPPSTTMWVRIDVSEDLAPTAAETPMPVSVVTGSQVVRGDLAITSSQAPWIFVTPSTMERPPSDAATPYQYTLRIQARNMEFLDPEAESTTDTESSDPDLEGAERTIVDFPENPGLTAASVHVLGPSELETTVLVYPEALTRSTPIVVGTPSRQASARVTVKSKEGAPYLEVHPGNIPYGSAGRLVWIKAVDFSFRELQSISCLETGCTVDSFEIIETPGDEPEEAFVWLTLNTSAMEAGLSTVSIRAVTQTSEAMGRLRLVPISTNTIEALPRSIQRGNTNLNLMLSLRGPLGAKFSSLPLPEVRFSPRSGLAKAGEPELIQGSQRLLVPIKAAKDAPLGPAPIFVTNGQETLETLLSITAMGASNEKVLRVGQTLVSRGKGRAIVDIHSERLWGDHSPSFQFDNPGISLEDFTRLDDQTGRATLKLSPGARAGQSMVYSEGEFGKTAASFMIQEPSNPAFLVPKLAPSTLFRSKGSATVHPRTQTVHLRTQNETWQWNPEHHYLPEIMEGIGVEISAGRVDPTDPSYLVVEFELAEVGPGGLLGILVPMGDRIGLAYLPVQGDDQSLTLALTPSALVAGQSETSLSAVLPDALDISSGLVEAHTVNAEVKVRLPLGASKETPLLVDVALNAPSSVPVFIRGVIGAAVGLLQIKPLISHRLEGPGPESWIFLEPKTRLLEVVPDSFPALATFEWIGETPISMELVTTEGDGPWFDRQSLAPNLSSFLLSTAQTRLVVRTDEASTLRGRTQALETRTNPSTMLVDKDPCLEPLLARGHLDDAFSSHSFVFSTPTTCEIALVAIARDALNQPWVTADTYLEMRDPDNLPLVPAMASAGWPTQSAPDPTIYCPPIGTDLELGSSALLTAENAATGEYLFNARRPQILLELSRAPGASFIEIEGKPGSSTVGLYLVVYDLLGASSLAQLEVSSEVPLFPSSGILVVAATPLEGADIVHEVGALPSSGGFAVALIQDGQIVDAVQVGSTLGLFWGEGSPIPDYPGVDVFSRMGGIDTNDNARDFVPMTIATPGR